MVQTALLEVLNEDVWLVSIAWERVDQLIKDNDRYSLLSAKVEEDRRNGKERLPPRQVRSWDEGLGYWIEIGRGRYWILIGSPLGKAERQM
jgi:hypothetical protein